MMTARAIVLAAIVLAAAQLIGSRWQVGSHGGMSVLLDRWTGNVSYCLSGDQQTRRMDCGG